MRRAARRYGTKRTCSFCFKRRQDVPGLAQGPQGVAICAECVRLCVEIFAEDAMRREEEREQEKQEREKEMREMYG